MGGTTNNGDGWYVVIDQDECILFAAHYRNLATRNQVETKVAERLVPGTWYGTAKTLQKALEDALWKARMYGGQQDARSESEGT